MAKTVALSERGRLLPDRPTLEAFGGALLFAAGQLLVSAFDKAKRRVVVSAYRVDERGTWRKAREFEVPFECPELEGFTEWTTATLTAWEPRVTRICVQHTLTPSGAKGTSENQVSSWVGDLELTAGKLISARAEGIPKCRFEDTDVSFSEGALHVVTGTKTFKVADPDADKTSRFGEAAVLVDATSIWVAAPGAYSTEFEPRLHEFDRRSGALKRTLRLGKKAPQSLGWEGRFWNGGILLSAGNAGQAAFVPLESEPAEPAEPVALLGDPSWETRPHGYVIGQTSVCSLGKYGVIGAPFGKGGAGIIVFLKSPTESWAALSGKRKKHGKGIGIVVAADAPWLASASPYDKGGVVHIVRVPLDERGEEDGPIEPADIAQEMQEGLASA